MRKLELWQTAGFSERSHKYFMKIQADPRSSFGHFRPKMWKRDYSISEEQEKALEIFISSFQSK